MGERENSYLIFMGQKEAIARKNYFWLGQFNSGKSEQEIENFIH
jgi:hypothetical protein